MAPGQILRGSNVIGWLNFQSAASQPSGYTSLPVTSVAATKPTSVPYANAIPTAGQVAIINNLAILQAAATESPTRTLTILGRIGNTYQIQYCTNFGPGSAWYPLSTYAQTNIAQTINLDPTVPQAFYRVQQK
jgi:hypothetical protein